MVKKDDKFKLSEEMRNDVFKMLGAWDKEEI